MAMPEVGLPTRAGAADGDAALRCGRDVNRGVAHASGDQELELGSFSITARGKPGALAHGADDLEVCSALTRYPPAEMLVEDLDVELARDARPVGHCEGDVLEVVEDCAAVFCHGASFGGPLGSGGRPAE